MAGRVLRTRYNLILSPAGRPTSACTLSPYLPVAEPQVRAFGGGGADPLLPTQLRHRGILHRPSPYTARNASSLTLTGETEQLAHWRQPSIPGRDRPCGRPPGQIPASTASALGSYLGCGRRIGRSARDA
jgi:hypothetical protein